MLLKMMQLRDYQKKAVEKLKWSMQFPGADLCVMATGAGKSLVIAELSNEINEAVLILQPSKEILEQNVAKMKLYVQEKEIGIYSASVGRKDIRRYTFATIQSIYKKPEDFNHFKFVIIDECHLVNPKNLDTMFMQFLKGIGNPKVIGLTATPYRMDVAYESAVDGGWIAHTATKLINRMGKLRFWHRLVFNIDIGDLIAQGYLSGMEYFDKAIVAAEDLPVNKAESDYDLEAFTELTMAEEDEIYKALSLALDTSKHVLVFCATVDQAEYLAKQYEINGAVVSSRTKPKERTRVIEGFRNGEIKMVFNVGVLTTGFDFPELDCIVLLRPTQSIGLYYQMLGRGVRKAEGKEHCKVIDLTSTVKKLGRVESIKLAKLDTGWELISETGKWHNTFLYSYKVSR